MSITASSSASSLKNLEPVHNSMIRAENCTLENLKFWLRSSGFKGSHLVTFFPQTTINLNGWQGEVPAVYTVWSGSHSAYVTPKSECHTLASKLRRVGTICRNAGDKALLIPLRPFGKQLGIDQWKAQQETLNTGMAEARKLIARMGTLNDDILLPVGKPLRVKDVLRMAPVPRHQGPSEAG